MAQSDGTESQQASKLSAEVEPFVPGHNPPEHWNSNKHSNHHPQHVNTHPMTGPYPKPNQPANIRPSSQSVAGGPGGGNGHPLTELPRYMTSCYPFVQDSSTGAAPRTLDVRWPNYPPPPQPPYAQFAPPTQYPPSTQHHLHPSHPPPLPQHPTNPLPNGPPPHEYFAQSPCYPHASMPRPPTSHSQAQAQHPSYPHPSYSQYPNHPYGSGQPPTPPPPPPPHSVPQGSIHGPSPHFQGPPAYPGYYPNYPPTSMVGNHYQSGGQPPFQTTGGQYPAATNRSYNNSRQIRHRAMSNMPREHMGNFRNTATHGYSEQQQQPQQLQQHQAQHSRSSNKESTKKTPKTLVYVEVSSQTDFPDDIANKTLVERPSTLRKHKTKPRRKSQGNQTGQENSTSTDSEVDAGTVDSDSGYYSPKHARSTMGVNTNDAATGPSAKRHGSPNHSAITRILSQPSPGAVTSIAPPMYGRVGMIHGQPLPSANYAPPQVPVMAPPQPRLPQTMSYARILSQAPPQPSPMMHQHIRKVGPAEQIMQPPVAHRTVSGAQVPRTAQPPQYRGVRTTNTQGNLIKNSAGQKPEKADTQGSSSRRKKKKQRKQQRGGGSGGGDSNQSEETVMTAAPRELPPMIQDTSEYPELLSGFGNMSVSGGVYQQHQQPASYSAILQQKAPMRRTSGRDSSSEEDPSNSLAEIIQPEDLLNPEAAAHGIRDGKNARKRRKKAIMAAQAAAKEYSEITEEQRQLQENFKKPNKRTKMPIEFDLGDMLAALEKQQQELNAKRQQNTFIQPTGLPPLPSNIPFFASALVKPKPPVQHTQGETVMTAHNPLDMSAPAKRGKEREAPAKKKPSALKRVILKEREEKKRLRTLEESCLSDAENEQSNSDDDEEEDDDDEQALDNVVGSDPGMGLSQDAASERGSISAGFTTSQSDLSPLSQMSPMSMSPLSPGSPLSSGLSSPATGMRTNSPAQVTPKIHSRRFREYCNQVLDKDIDACCTTLLQTLVRFQDRQYHKDPHKAKAKRRIVMGLREVTKHLKLKKIKCIIVSPNLERIQSKGGLDEALNTITSLSHEQNVPVIFALGRKALGRAVNKLVPVSVVGIFNQDGAEDMYKSLLDLSQKARDDYREMVRKFQQELEAAQVPRIPKPHRHHLGHYRNLSGCSAISFSSVISEPISEDYPDPEPPVDSRGNEIERADNLNDKMSYSMNPYGSGYPNKQIATPDYQDVSDKDGSEAAHTEESGTIENCASSASKASSETIEAKEINEVDNDEDNDEEYEDLVDDNGAELDAIEAALEDEEEGDEDVGDIAILKDSSLPVDKQRVAHWVAETQNCLDSLSLKDADTDDLKDAAAIGKDSSSDKETIIITTLPEVHPIQDSLSSGKGSDQIDKASNSQTQVKQENS